MSTPSSAESLGARIDAVLAPFTADEQRLLRSIEELKGQIAELTGQIENSQRDLDVVRTSKIESLRNAAQGDPLLSAAFSGVAAAAEAEQQAAADQKTSAVEPAAKTAAPEVRAEAPAAAGPGDSTVGSSLLKF